MLSSQLREIKWIIVDITCACMCNIENIICVNRVARNYWNPYIESVSIMIHYAIKLSATVIADNYINSLRVTSGKYI